MYKIKNNINQLSSEWNKSNNIFISKDLLECFYINNKEIEHLYITKDEINIYAHLFYINLKKSSYYIQNPLFSRILLRLFKIKVLFLTNSYITNVESFSQVNNLCISQLISSINSKYTYSLLVIPDFLFNKLKSKDPNQFLKIEIEEDMKLEIKNKWKSVEDYKNDLKAKYRKKINTIQNRSSNININKLTIDDFNKHKNTLNILFKNIINNSKFNGPLFNINTLKCMMEKNIIHVYGYFINRKLIAFSSEINDNSNLYSYYVGFNKVLNKKYSIYGRILLETITNAIRTNKKQIIYGRTANEFKSNFGAKAVKSYVYIKIQNKLTYKLYDLYLRKLQTHIWTERSPFK